MNGDSLERFRWMNNAGIDALFRGVQPITVRPVNTDRLEQIARDMKARIAREAVTGAHQHERATTGVDRRHWSETTVPGSEDQS